MAYTITLDPSAVATGRTALELNSGPIRVEHAGIDWGDAQIQAYAADQRWGSSVVDFRVPNRTVTIPLGLGMDASSFTTAKRQLSEKVALLQREGGSIRRGDTGWYADVVNATLNVPDRWGEGGGVELDVKLVLECLPDFYGDEITLDATTGTNGVASVALKSSGTQAAIAGDHPGRVRIVVTDTSGHDQQGLLWGVRSRHYDSASTAKLFYEAEALTPLDAAATHVLAGSSGGSTMRHNSLPADSWCPVLLTDILSGTAAWTHQGSYRIWARCYSATATPQLRMLWGVGDVAHPVSNDAVSLPGAGAFYVISLGTVRLDAPPTGNYRWHGVIQALAASAGDPVEIDCLYLQPLDESAGQLIAVQSNSPFGTFPNESFISTVQSPGGVAVDANFVYIALGKRVGRANLDGSGLNESFITVAGSTEWVAVDGAHVYWTDFVNNTIGRANLDGSSPDDSFITGASKPGGIAVDASFVYWCNAGTGTVGSIGRATLAGASVNQSFIASAQPEGIAVDGSFIYWGFAGGAVFRATLAGGSAAALISGLSSVTGVAVDGSFIYWTDSETLGTIARATLAGGSLTKPFIAGPRVPMGIAVDGTYLYWANEGAHSIGRGQKSLAPLPDAVVYASRQSELRTEGMFRQDSTGTVEGAVAQVIGDLPRLPPSGLEGRAVELFCKPSRGDIASLPDAGLDGFSAQVIYRPCYLTSP